MKRFVLFLSLFICTQAMTAQTSYEEDSYVSDEMVLTNFGLPAIRNIYGTSRIIPVFEGNWTNEMKGAFEYACKIWEEVIPSCFPIHIRAIMNTTDRRYVNKPTLSKVTVQVHIHEGGEGPILPTASSYAQIKGTKYKFFNETTYGNFLDSAFFVEPDAEITYFNYNNKISDNCSFSLQEDIDASKYDFVTLVMRDLAKSFGLLWRYRRQQDRTNLSFTEQNLIGFEYSIVQAINDGNSHNEDNALAITYPYTFKLYNPAVWDNERSLSYFIPDPSFKLSQLMSFDFGRGSMIRDISDKNTNEFFTSLMWWREAIPVGIGHDKEENVGKAGAVDGTVGYNSVISLTDTKSTSRTLYAIPSIQSIDQNSWFKEVRKFFPVSNPMMGWYVNLQKKDGSWDCVYYKNSQNLNVSTSDLSFHYDMDEYARSCDGYLKCNISKATPNINYARYDVSFSKNFLLDYLPQRVELSLSRVLPIVARSDDYYRDVEIGIKNLEGTDKIIVEQLDEGEEFPYYYEVENFKKGYFTATVDKEYTSSFRVTAYNKNGSSTSEQYILSPLEPAREINLSFDMKGDRINVIPNERKLRSGKVCQSYMINELSSNRTVKSSQERSDNIDISKLEKNKYYILLATDIKGAKHAYKFIRK